MAVVARLDMLLESSSSVAAVEKIEADAALVALRRQVLQTLHADVQLTQLQSVVVLASPPVFIPA